eukprot:9021913-Pyramimonas_sp.AAC.1
MTDVGWLHRKFLMVDNFNGITVYSYEGRQLCNPKFQGLRTEFLNGESISLSDDTLAVIDRSDAKGALRLRCHT